MRKLLAIPILILIFLLVGTVLIVFYGKGYRIETNPNNPRIKGTGLLVATSQPDGAQVFINGNLTTATNNTINLTPTTYKVQIIKEGYFPWEKTIKIQKEVVSVANALLFAKAPKLESITGNGVLNPVMDPSMTKIAFTVASQSARKNGVYILDMTLRPILTLRSASTQITDDTIDIFSQAKLEWSPDGKELLSTIESSANPLLSRTYLLESSTFNNIPQNVTATLEITRQAWEEELMETEKSQINSLNPKLKKLIAQNFKIISWSPDETKILYSASKSANLYLTINPPLIGTDSTPQERNVKENSVYVYDIKEDKNFKISDSIEPQLPLTWLPDSKHLIFVSEQKIGIMEYDGTNRTIIFAGPFSDKYVFPWPDNSKLVVLTNLGNNNVSPNLYTIGLK